MGELDGPSCYVLFWGMGVDSGADLVVEGILARGDGS